MSRNVQMLRPTVYHRGSKIAPNGDVSALCFKTPHRIDLGKAMWTLDDKAVTCPRCRALIRARATP